MQTYLSKEWPSADEGLLRAILIALLGLANVEDLIPIPAWKYWQKSSASCRKRCWRCWQFGNRPNLLQNIMSKELQAPRVLDCSEKMAPLLGEVLDILSQQCELEGCEAVIKQLLNSQSDGVPNAFTDKVTCRLSGLHCKALNHSSQGLVTVILYFKEMQPQGGLLTDPFEEHNPEADQSTYMDASHFYVCRLVPSTK